MSPGRPAISGLKPSFTFEDYGEVRLQWVFGPINYSFPGGSATSGLKYRVRVLFAGVCL